VRGRETRRRILDAARIRIMRDGYEGLRLEALGRDAGVSKAAVIKSVGSKASILLELGDEDRRARIELLRAAIPLRTGLRRRLADTVHALLVQDVARLDVVMAYIGHMWFWSGTDHSRAQGMLDETRALLRDLVASASSTRLTPARLDTLALRIMAGYAIGLRDLYYGRATLDECVHLVVEHTME
jgi:AcrR family transcriptional regulator